MDRRVWWATVHGVAKSRTGLSEHTQGRGALPRFPPSGRCGRAVRPEGWITGPAPVPSAQASHLELQLCCPSGGDLA